MVMHSFGGGPEDERMHQFSGPGQVDQQIRQALQMCWMAMPSDQKNVDAVEREFCRLVDRAIRDLREDGEAFGARSSP